ncbi:MAG TPA: M20/M25/M40 family metallo-hydrolase, partial [Candidatus Saccharimonadales bacterium]
MIDNRETLSALVAIPSETGNEQAIASYIAGRCSAPGNSVDEMADSVVVHIPGQDNTKAFVLNGHTDTVPPTEQWSCDPYTLRVDPNDYDRLIGLGTTDMMSGLAIMLDICDDAQEQPPPCDLWMVFSSREETDGFGSKEVAPWLSEKIRGRYRSIGGLILEPTNAEFVGVGHRGDTVWDMAAHGPGGHASKHFDGETPPIEKLSRVLVDLPDIRRQWAAKYTNTLLGRPSINPTVINAGNAENVVPTQANALLNLRVTPELV